MRSLLAWKTAILSSFGIDERLAEVSKHGVVPPAAQDSHHGDWQTGGFSCDFHAEFSTRIVSGSFPKKLLATHCNQSLGQILTANYCKVSSIKFFSIHLSVSPPIFSTLIVSESILCDCQSLFLDTSSCPC